MRVRDRREEVGFCGYSWPTLHSRADWDFAQAAAEEQQSGKVLDSANTAARLVAAARFSFDRDPAAYLPGKHGDGFKQHIQNLVHPGVRAGEAKASEVDKQNLSENSRSAGEAWFDDFASWAGVRKA